MKNRIVQAYPLHYFTVEMTKKNPQPLKLSAAELQLIEQLREHPELLDRFRTLLAITATGDGPPKRADEIEGLLSAELRRLGNATMASWPAGFKL